MERLTKGKTTLPQVSRSSSSDIKISKGNFAFCLSIFLLAGKCIYFVATSSVDIYAHFFLLT